MTKLIEQLKVHEGLRLNPYQCTAGKWTIGYGRNLEDNGITKFEAELLLNHDVAGVIMKLSTAVDGWHFLNEARKAVLVNMAFNMGVSGLLAFKKTLGYIRLKMYKEASVEMLDSAYGRGKTKNRALELSAQMESGEFK
jgi:lysozyme